MLDGFVGDDESVSKTGDRYKILARKYRPQNFLQLLGQDILVKVLSYSIVNNKLAHSYILTGTRGIGKTTTARIIAKTINCSDVVINDQIPISCEKCNNCVSFNKSSHPDILEIDAASRTGVDDVRVIIENSEYKPILGKYKVFIIDEVHMLSKNAFNALLKLLEEPPLHSLFIFATTEIHKIPLTVISRCQRFDLSRFSSELLYFLFKDICLKENISYEDDALKILSQKSDGSARDGISLLDQSIALASSLEKDNKIVVTKSVVQDMVGIIDYGLISKYILFITKNDVKNSLEIISTHYSLSGDFSIFIDEILNLISYISKKITIEEYKEYIFSDIEDVISEIIELTNLAWLQLTWQILFKSSIDLRSSHNQLQFMEMLTLKLIYAYKIPDFSEMKNETDEQKKNFNDIEKKGNIGLISDSLYENKNMLVKENFDCDLNNQTVENFAKFVLYLRDSLEFDLYYQLFNNCEIEEFSENKIIFKTKILDEKLKTDLKKHLKEWSNRDFNIISGISSTIRTFRDYYINKMKKTDMWQKLVKDFKNVSIKDIVIK